VKHGMRMAVFFFFMPPVYERAEAALHGGWALCSGGVFGPGPPQDPWSELPCRGWRKEERTRKGAWRGRLMNVCFGRDTRTAIPTASGFTWFCEPVCGPSSRRTGLPSHSHAGVCGGDADRPAARTAEVINRQPGGRPGRPRSLAVLGRLRSGCPPRRQGMARERTVAARPRGIAD